jgi:hypothetical protein
LINLGRAELPNVMARVVDSNEIGFKLGTRQGLLKHHYPATSFSVLNEKFLSEADIPSTSEKSLREVATAEAIGPGQKGRIHCNCTKNCQNNRCRCVTNKVQCNSKCHLSKPCLNKHESF